MTVPVIAWKFGADGRVPKLVRRANNENSRCKKNLYSWSISQNEKGIGNEKLDSSVFVTECEVFLALTFL